MCGETSGVTRDDDGYSCLLCGGPRVIVDPPFAREYQEKPFLVRARELRKKRAAWGVAAGVATAFGAFALVVAGVLALIIHLSAAGGELAAALVLGPLLFATFGFARVKTASTAVRAALGEAELVVTEEIARSRRATVDAAELSAILHVPLARAEELAARAQVEGFLGGEERPPADRVRVDPGDVSEPSDALGTAPRNRVP
jgi:hypothetical protein